MANILDYIAFRGDLTFEERPFNDVDSLILTELAYLDMGNITPGRDSRESICLEEFHRLYEKAGIDQSYLVNDPKRLLKACAGSERFRNARFEAFVNIVDKEKDMQFAAVTVTMEHALLYVAFSGTDNSLAGWKEDCNISYETETPSQKEAAVYLDMILERKQEAQEIYCGGHSKGGNLAIYASAFCSAPGKDRIRCIYSFDGPGFNRSVSSQRQYRRILPKVKLSIPETSLVGILLSNTKHWTIVRNEAKGACQHDPYTWEVTRDGFETVSELSNEGLFLNDVLNKWIDGLEPTERKEFVTTVFDLLESSGATTTTGINANKRASFNAIAKAARAMDPERQKTVVSVLKELADVSRDTLMQEILKNFRSHTGRIEEQKQEKQNKEQETNP